MKGSHRLIIQSSHLKYDMSFKRNITIIKGNTATGKTTLVDMIREYNSNGADTGISFKCDVPCKVLEGNDWEAQLSIIHNSIVFVDEGNRFISSKDFASAILGSDNYYVLITRESISTLPYSVSEIYGIHSSGRYNSLEPVYHEMYRIYGNDDYDATFDPEIILTEDSNSGYELFSFIGDANGKKCISANGKDKVFGLIESNNLSGNILIIADGAAFGSQMEKVSDAIIKRSNIKMYLPESFEWIILDSDVLNDADVRNILSSPEDHIESKDFFSWERYFTHLLVERSQDTFLKYNKHKLNKNYLNEKIIDQIKKVLPEKLKI